VSSKGKSFHFSFFPEKYIAGTRHLSRVQRGIYWDMCCNIWMLTPTQYSFPDTIPMWMTLTGIDDEVKVKSIRQIFLKEGLSLFRKMRRKNVNQLLQNGLKKERSKQRKKSRQNALNARTGLNQGVKAKRSLSQTHTDASDSASLSLCLMPYALFLTPVIKRAIADLAPKGNEQEVINKLSTIASVLHTQLSEHQIVQILKYVPGITPEYVKEKIELVKKRNPVNKAGYLYGAILQDYKLENKIDTPEEIHPMIKKAMRMPISSKDFDSVPDNLKKRFNKINTQEAKQNIFILQKKPESFKESSHKIMLGTFEIGDKIYSREFEKLPDYLKILFKKDEEIIPSQKKYKLK